MRKKKALGRGPRRRASLPTYLLILRWWPDEVFEDSHQAQLDQDVAKLTRARSVVLGIDLSTVGELGQYISQGLAYFLRTDRADGNRRFGPTFVSPLTEVRTRRILVLAVVAPERDPVVVHTHHSPPA